MVNCQLKVIAASLRAMLKSLSSPGILYRQAAFLQDAELVHFSPFYKISTPVIWNLLKSYATK